MDNKYEAYLDKGRLRAIDLDSGEVFIVKINKRRVFSSILDDECPYEIYEEDGELYYINTETAETGIVELTKYNV